MAGFAVEGQIASALTPSSPTAPKRDFRRFTKTITEARAGAVVVLGSFFLLCKFLFNLCLNVLQWNSSRAR
jgi:hypothetical protein